MAQAKTCTKCGEHKELTEFHRMKSGKYGRTSQCRVCRSSYYSSYYAKNRQKQADRHAENYTARGGKWVKNLARTAMLRARKYNLPYDRDAVEATLAAAPDVCPALGIRLVAGNGCTEDSPTLDRIIPKKGYVEGNLQVVSRLANSIKASANAEQVRRVADFMERQGRVP